ncbi:right-handed parallel beta-helix repeat-containing protein [Candidatus Bipolaricaulota bacterium]|nr:right-handed parallel beta-helix repeat-containing protein [Candidatus Bipolaricaulota bacterium]
MGTSKAKLVVAALIVLFCSVVAFGAVFHVPADYNDIQTAVAAASSGDTVIVAAGEYGGVSIVDKVDFTLRGEPGAIIRGRVLINNCTNLTIEGFQITSPKEGILVIGRATGLVIRNNEIFACKTHGIVFAGQSVSTDVIIEGNRIAGNGYDGIQLLGTATTGTGEEEMPITIKGNEIANNGRSSATGVGIRVGKDSSALIADNVIVGNPFAGIHPA